MNTKYCKRCDTDKEYKDFAKNTSKSGGLQAYCRSCKKLYDAEEYKKNKNKQNQRNLINKKKYKDKVNSYKKEKGCLFCKENEVCCLDFHHIDSNTKLDTIANLQKKSQKLVWEEIEKCIVLCANCHRKLHAGIIRLD